MNVTVNESRGQSLLQRACLLASTDFIRGGLYSGPPPMEAHQWYPAFQYLYVSISTAKVIPVRDVPAYNS